MTESQAWSYLAQKWKYPIQDITDKDYWIRIHGHFCLGLCESIRLLRMEHLINDIVYFYMQEALKLYRIQNNIETSFFWYSNRKGAKKRAVLCRKFAKETKIRK